MAKKPPKIVRDIQNYKPPEVEYSYQKTISYSQLSMFLQCPHQWSLQYKDGHKVLSHSIFTVFGTALHETLQHYLNVMYNRSNVLADEENLIEIFEEKMRKGYKESYEKNNKLHFSSPEEIKEFFDDGVEILKFIKKKRGNYFSKRGWWLIGCEIPILTPVSFHSKNLIFQGFLDVVLYHEPTNTIKILDIKTSRYSWNNKQKKNKIKQYQLLLYKKFFSQQFNFPIENIEVEFFIVKRKIFEESEFVQNRVQKFIPPSGKNSINKVNKALNNFIVEAFNSSGYIEKNHIPIVNDDNCKYCPFYKSNLCPATS